MQPERRRRRRREGWRVKKKQTPQLLNVLLLRFGRYFDNVTGSSAATVVCVSFVCSVAQTLCRPRKDTSL